MVDKRPVQGGVPGNPLRHKNWLELSAMVMSQMGLIRNFTFPKEN